MRRPQGRRCAIAADLCLIAFGVRLFLDDNQLVFVKVIIGLHISKAVDAGNDICGVFTKTVQDDTQRLLADFVRRAGDTDGTLCCGEGFMPGKETEAFRLFPQKHSGEVTVPETDLSALGDGTGDAEGLQADADGFGGFSRIGHTLFKRDSHTERIGPSGIVKRDGLHALDDCVNVDIL